MCIQILCTYYIAAMETLKCVVVGDANVGKKHLLITFTTGIYPSEYCPTVFDCYTQNIILENKSYNLGLSTIAGIETYERLRPLSYNQADVVLVCFSIDSDASFQNVTNIWIPEIRLHRPNTPILIVGTKIDLRGDKEVAKQNKKLISSKQGRKLAEELQAVKYLECSARTQKGLKELFNEAVLATIESPNEIDNPKKCLIM